jgi:hypothetical protein
MFTHVADQHDTTMEHTVWFLAFTNRTQLPELKYLLQNRNHEP